MATLKIIGPHVISPDYESFLTISMSHTPLELSSSRLYHEGNWVEPTVGCSTPSGPWPIYLIAVAAVAVMALLDPARKQAVAG